MEKMKKGEIKLRKAPVRNGELLITDEQAMYIGEFFGIDWKTAKTMFKIGVLNQKSTRDLLILYDMEKILLSDNFGLLSKTQIHIALGEKYGICANAIRKAIANANRMITKAGVSNHFKAISSIKQLQRKNK